MGRYCVKCKEVICEDRAKYYIPPLSDMCNECRKEEIMKRNFGVKLKK